MRSIFSFAAGLGLLTLGLAAPAAAQQLNNDGFQRRHGQMYVLRNGQPRPMTRDARLPTGTVITKDGFVVNRAGTRTELREGQGCDLRGNVVAVVPAGTGLALAAPAARRAGAGTPADQVRAVLTDLLGGPGYAEDDERYDEYRKKAEERAREQRKKEEEWRRESEKRLAEYERERGKKGKHKWKRGKGWDD